MDEMEGTSPMSAYPDDVMKAAREAAAKADPAISEAFMSGRYDDSTRVLSACEAILAEREATARIVSAFRLEAMNRPDYSHAAFDAHIAAIRKGD